MYSVRPLDEDDTQLIKSIVLDPVIFGECREDGEDINAEFTPDFCGWAYIGCFVGREIVGLQEIRLINRSTVELHFRALPKIRGKLAYILAKETLRVIFDRLSVNKLNIIIPEYCKNVRRFTVLCGFKKEGLSKGSFLKNGQYHNQVMYGLMMSEYERL